MFTIITFVIVLSLLVFVHEFGHFITAKRAGMRVDEFGFGFPPRAFGIKRGGTVYSVNWIPLGGFVKIKGETGEDAKDKDSFASKPGWTRAGVLTAGVVMNVLTAWLLLSVGYLVGMPQQIEELSKFARVSDHRVTVMEVLPGSPAAAAEIQPGDTVLTLDGRPVQTTDEVRDYTAQRGGTPIVVTLQRRNETVSRTVTPAYLEEAQRQSIGIALIETGFVRYPLWLAPIQGAQLTYAYTREILLSFGGLFRDLFTKQQVSVDVSGPVGIAQLTGEVAAMGFRYLLQFTALLSLNLAIINILPFPALDGGRVLFLVIEKLRGRAVNRNVEAWSHNIGFALLMILVLAVTVKDLSRFFQ